MTTHEVDRRFSKATWRPWITSKANRFVKSSAGARTASAVLLLLLWQFAIPLFGSDLLPTPLMVFSEMWEFVIDGVFVRQFSISLSRFVAGFMVSLLLGTALGVMIGLSRIFEAGVRDFVTVGLAFPDLIWALLIAMWLGLGNIGPTVVMILASTPYVMTNIAAGVRDVPLDLVRMGRAYSVPTKRIVRHIILPSLGPFLFAALRYTLAIGWPALIGAEVFAAQSGAGFQLVEIRRTTMTASMVGWGLFFVIFAITIERLVFVRASQRVFRWRPKEHKST